MEGGGKANQIKKYILVQKAVAWLEGRGVTRVSGPGNLPLRPGWGLGRNWGGRGKNNSKMGPSQGVPCIPVLQQPPDSHG